MADQTTRDTDPARMPAGGLLRHYARGTLGPVDVLKATAHRVARLNPDLNSFAVMNPRALVAAGDSEARWQAGRPIGPLDGVPVTLTDLMDMAGFPTRHGSRVPAAGPALADSPVALGLRHAGAVILGKTAPAEHGWKPVANSPLHGISRNPWNPTLSPGNAAAAAIAAGFGALHAGTDVLGEVRLAAAWCGVVGFRPTPGLVPLWPASPFAPFAAAGLLATTVTDAALLAAALAQPDARDPDCRAPAPGWTGGMEASVAGLRVAVIDRTGLAAPVDADGIAAVEQAAALLADAGAEVEAAEPDLPDLAAALADWHAAALAALVAGLAPAQQGLLDPGLQAAAELGLAISGPRLLAALATFRQAAHVMAQFARAFDVILCPTTPAAPPAATALTDPADPLHHATLGWTAPFSLTGAPALSLPLGLGASGLPRSVQLAAAPGRDALVLRAAAHLERAVPAPEPPLFPGLPETDA